MRFIFLWVGDCQACSFVRFGVKSRRDIEHTCGMRDPGKSVRGNVGRDWVDDLLREDLEIRKAEAKSAHSPTLCGLHNYLLRLPTYKRGCSGKCSALVPTGKIPQSGNKDKEILFIGGMKKPRVLHYVLRSGPKCCYSTAQAIGKSSGGAGPSISHYSA